MNSNVLRRLVIDPVLAEMGASFNSPAATKLLGVIAQQESNLLHREQYPVGPAHGLWQFERGGGIAGVYTHRLTRPILREWCIELIVPFSIDAIYEAIVLNDHLACVCARLLLYTDPFPLPVDTTGAWEYYLRTWRPGKPRQSEWQGNWLEAGMVP